jgi:hypothetical protein
MRSSCHQHFFPPGSGAIGFNPKLGEGCLEVPRRVIHNVGMESDAVAPLYNNPSSRAIVDTLRLSDRELLRLAVARATPIDQLDATERADRLSPLPPAANLPRMLMRIQDPTCNQWTTYLVKPCDFHDHGLVVLHGAFVYEGVRCALLLRHRNGQPAQLPATVLRCCNVGGRVYQLVATFEAAISLDEYIFADGASINDAIARGAIKRSSADLT